MDSSTGLQVVGDGLSITRLRFRAPAAQPARCEPVDTCCKRDEIKRESVSLRGSVEDDSLRLVSFGRGPLPLSTIRILPAVESSARNLGSPQALTTLSISRAYRLSFQVFSNLLANLNYLQTMNKKQFKTPHRARSKSLTQMVRTRAFGVASELFIIWFD